MFLLAAAGCSKTKDVVGRQQQKKPTSKFDSLRRLAMTLSAPARVIYDSYGSSASPRSLPLFGPSHPMMSSNIVADQRSAENKNKSKTAHECCVPFRKHKRGISMLFVRLRSLQSIGTSHPFFVPFPTLPSMFRASIISIFPTMEHTINNAANRSSELRSEKNELPKSTLLGARVHIIDSLTTS